MGGFRGAIDGELTLQFRFRGWRLAALVSAHTPLPEHVRHQWPELVRNASFIQEMAQHMDMSESLQDMRVRIAAELRAHLGDGPFLGGLDQPTMLDLAVFPQLVWGFMFGLEETLSAAADPDIKEWLRRVAGYLPANPTLVADAMQIKALSAALD